MDNPNPLHSYLRFVGSLRSMGSFSSIRSNNLHRSGSTSSFVHPGVISSSTITTTSSIALPITSRRVVSPAYTQIPIVSKMKQPLQNEGQQDEAYVVIFLQALHVVRQPMIGSPLPHKLPSYLPNIRGYLMQNRSITGNNQFS
jgi:hypothetical protein